MKLIVSALALTVAVVANAQKIDTAGIYSNSRSIDEVVVTGTRNATDVRHLPLTVTSISHKQLEQAERLSILPTVMEQTPGLFSTSRGVLGYGVSTGGAGSMKIRGVGSGAELLVLIDGQPQYAGLMGHPIPDAYQTMMAEKVEVLRGPASLYYGSNAMAGVVNIVTRQMPYDGVKTHIRLQGGSYGTLQADATNRLKAGKFSSILGLNYQRTDGHRANSQFEQMTGFLKLGYDVNKNWKLNADLDVTHFNASNPGPVSAPMIDNDSKITRGLASFSVNNNYAKTNGSLRVYYDWGHHNINDGYAVGGTPKTYLYKHNDYIGGITWYQSASLFDGNRTTVGVDWQRFGGEAWNSALADGKKTFLTKDDNGNIVPKLHQNEIAGYVDFRQVISPLVSFDAGLRLDHHSQAGTELVPQGGLAFHITPESDIKAMVSKGFRNPIIREMYMFPPANNKLEPERMVNYEVSFTQRFGDKGHFAANLFYIDGDNLINTVYNAEVKHMLNVNTGEFKNWGLELSGDYIINSKWDINANYSYLRMDKPIVGAPEGKLYIGANYHCGRFGLSAGIQNVNGLYITTGENAKKENYTLVNANAWYKATTNIRFFVKGDNLLAERYETYDGFIMPKATFMGGVSIEF